MIKAGDLVMVVRGRMCCGNTNRVGAVYRVTRIAPHRIGNGCSFCGSKMNYGDIAIGYNSYQGIAVNRLKRIDPPALDETTETDEELTV